MPTGSVDFSASSTAMARVASAVVSSFPVSMFAFCKPFSVPAANVPAGSDRQFGILCVDNSSSNLNFVRLNLANSDFGTATTGYSAGNIVGLSRARTSTGGVAALTITDNTSWVQTNSWAAMGATFDTSPSTPTVKAYKDGVDQSYPTQTNSFAFPTLNETLIGREAIVLNQTGRNFDGLICRVGIWTTTLSAAEMALLAAGTDPTTIQSSSLVSYWPGNVINVAGSDYMEDVWGSNDALLSGGAVADTDEPTFFKPYWAHVSNTMI